MYLAITLPPTENPLLSISEFLLATGSSAIPATAIEDSAGIPIADSAGNTIKDSR